ncbi:MAG TPA: hypothetical protein VM029_04105 [Opitutaceae bacterium]|nr:hypothetical protein [Opitutaceae bacterium]
MTASGEQPRMRRSTQVALVLLGTAGVVGVATTWDAWRRSREREKQERLLATTPPEAAPVSAERTYTNNEYVPGVGYYHAPFFAWYPFPWNFHNPARGYFAGGQWHTTPFTSGVLSSQPTPQAVAAAAAVQRARQQEQQRQARANFASSSNGSSSYSSRPAGTPSPKPSTTRSGFGSSSRGSSS